MKILKFVVAKSSSLQIVPQGPVVDTAMFKNFHGSYSDSELSCKKELAGRTMDFTFDISQTPLIGRRILLKTDGDGAPKSNAGQGYLGSAGTPNSPRRSASLSPADTAMSSGWKRPWMSQSRVRECLVNLLSTCGQRVGLPKSPSVSRYIQYFFLSFWLHFFSLIFDSNDNLNLCEKVHICKFVHVNHIGTFFIFLKYCFLIYEIMNF